MTKTKHAAALILAFVMALQLAGFIESPAYANTSAKTTQLWEIPDFNSFMEEIY